MRLFFLIFAFLFRFYLGAESIDVVIPCISKDAATLELCIKGIRENGQDIRRIIVVSPKKITSSAEWFAEKNYPFSKQDVAQQLKTKTPRLGWIYQQLLKLYAPSTIPGISSNVLVLDADTIFLNPTQFMNDKGEPLFNSGSEIHPPYFAHAAKLIPSFKRAFPEHSGITNFMLFQKLLVDKLFKEIAATHKTEPWKAICDCIDRAELNESCLSEYEIYFNYAFANFPAHLRPLKWKNNGTLDDLSKYKEEGYAYITCHEWTRPKYSLVLVHIGKELPSYLTDALAQVRLFNKECPIYLITNLAAELPGVKVIPCQTLKKTSQHENFLKNFPINKEFREGFLSHAMERFFYIEDFMVQHNKKYVFHMENDIMLYSDLKELFPIFKKHYKNKIGATFDNKHRCIPGFMYISSAKPLSALTSFFCTYKSKGVNNDMEYIAKFRIKHPESIDALPIIPPSYTPDFYSKNADTFHSLFDAAALGQYLGGIDPRNGESKPGFINEFCIFNPSHLVFSWEKDSVGRLIPYISYKEGKWRVNNLHIHSKNLKPFTSL